VLVTAVSVCITTSGSCSDPLLTTLLPAALGAVLGAVLGFGGSLLLRRGEREWQRSRDSFARELQVVKPLDEALVETQLRVTGAGVQEGQSRWEAAHREWENGWVRLTPHLTDDELEDRYKAVGTILTELRLRNSDQDDGLHAGSPVMIVMRAIGNARLALAYWLRGNQLPPASFPSSQQTIELLGQGDPRPLAADAPLRRWLAEHDQPPWRPEQPRRWWQRRPEWWETLRGRREAASG
jgi:hypothetical protein